MTKLSTVSFFLCMTLFIAACRKTDTLSPQMTDKEIAEKFLNLPATASPEIKRIAQRLELLNQKHGFLSSIGKQDGLPVWDKPIFNIPKNAARGQAKQASATSSDTIVYIPLVLENANHVNAFIYAKLNGTVHLQLHRGKEYANYGFGNIEDSTDNAERLALQIMVLDKEVFGHARFRLLDDRLFATQPGNNGNTAAPKRFLTIEDNGTNTNNNASARSSAHWEEGTITHCTYTEASYHCTHTGSCAGGTCDNCPLCVTPGTWHCVTTVQYYFVSDDDDDWGGGGGNPDPGGGGGGGSSPPSGPQPCNPTPELDNGLPPCPRGGGDGWIPELEPEFPSNPCETIDSLMKVPFFTAMYPYLRDSTSRNYEMGIYYKDPFTSPPALVKTTGEPDSLSLKSVIPNVPVDGFAHNHYNDPKRLSVFSPADLNAFYDLFKNGKIVNPKSFTFGVVTDSTAYILMITDTAAFRTFGNTFLGEENKQTFEGLLKDYDVNATKPASQNETGFLKMIKQLTFGGLTLFKGNNSLTEFKQKEFDYSTNEVKDKPCN